MKKNTLAILWLKVAFLICVTVSSCKKEENSKNLIVGKWRMTAYIHNGMDVFGTQVPPCVTDGIVTFTSDGKIIGDEGPTKCDVSDPQTIQGTYSLNGNNTELTYSINGSTEVDKILTLSSTTLKLEQNSNGDIITYTKLQ